MACPSQEIKKLIGLNETSIYIKVDEWAYRIVKIESFWSV